MKAITAAGIIFLAGSLVTACGVAPDAPALRGDLPPISAIEYSRDAFGPTLSRADPDGNGCDTRNEVLAEQLLEPVVADDCIVLSGTLHDPYTGEVESFLRGTTTSRLVQVDHVYALRDAWDDGAAQWPQEKRVAFANDHLNLVAATDNVNASKGARAMPEWLPPLPTQHCPYVGRYLLVASKYGLELDGPAQAYAEGRLEECGIADLTER